MLSVLAAALAPGSLLYSILTGAGVALGAAAVIVSLRHRNGPRLYQWLSAFGGVTILLIGILSAVARIGASAVLTTAALSASYTVIPFALAACYIGGLGQLPLRWIGPTFLATGGAATALWFSLGPLDLMTRLIIAFAAVVAITGCAIPWWRARSNPPEEIAGRLGLGACLLLSLLMLHMIGIALIPAWFWIPPIVLAWLYLAAGLSAALSGLLTSSRS